MYPQLEEHIGFLHQIGMVGASFHEVLFSAEEAQETISPTEEFSSYAAEAQARVCHVFL